MSINNMSRRNFLEFGGALAVACTFAGCNEHAARSDTLSRYASNLVTSTDFSGSILLARGKTVEFAQAYGLANRNTEQHNSVDTKFSLASISKMFTATCILQLIEAGALAFDDSIGKHMPDYPNQKAARDVTIKHLLMHTSGIGNFWEQLDKLQGKRPDQHRDYLPLFAGLPLEHEPGTAFSYSNGGYIILGLIIEKITGRNYFDHVQQAVFDKAGMPNTGYWRLDEAVPNRALGYMRSIETPGQWVDCTDRWEQRGSAAGGASATVGDMHRFAQALTRHLLLRPEMTKEFLQGRLETPVGRYGYGLIEQSLNGVRVIGHSGGHYGVAGELMMFPELDTTFVILSNGDVDGYWNMEMFAHELIVGQTDETRNHAFTQDLINNTVSQGLEAGALIFKKEGVNGRKAREGVIDLTAFKYLHRNQKQAGLNLLLLNRIIHPESDNTIFSLAQGYRVTDQRKKAIEQYHKYLERVPNDTEAETYIRQLTSTLIK